MTVLQAALFVVHQMGDTINNGCRKTEVTLKLSTHCYHKERWPIEYTVHKCYY